MSKRITLLFMVLLIVASQNLQKNPKQEDQQHSQYNEQINSSQLTQLDQDLLDQNNVLEDNCPPAQYYQFVQKQTITEEKIISDPYKITDPDYLQKVQQNLINKERVCALKYTDRTKKKYELKNFNSRSQAQSEGWIITHQGVCGKCSTTKDLYVYLTTDLTKPVRACGLRHFLSHNKLEKCILNLGFTKPCAKVWLYNTLHTKKQCGAICFWSYITQQPYVINGQLNRCLQCDQDKSGPVFKYESGRSRRNSGIKSQIDRPKDQIYNVTHCYY